MKRKIYRVLLLILVLVLAWAIHYAWVSFPIISGFDAKEMCTCFFVAGRDKTEIDASEFSAFPFSLAVNKININDSSVTSTVWGMAKKKAIYRKKAGCTLLNEIPENEVRSRQFSIPAPTSLNLDSIPWPNGEKTVDSIPAAIDKNRLTAAVDYAFTEPLKNKKLRTRAVVVVFNGQIVQEKYAPGFGRSTRMYGWSMAKSFTSALIGILTGQGRIQVTQPAPVPEWRDEKDPRHGITIENLLQQTSGLDFNENYSKASDATNMLYHADDMAAFTATHPLLYKPGSVFNYSSGNSNVLSRIIRQTVGEKDYAAYPYTQLFYKIGMYNTSFEADPSGTYVGSSYINATARDFARFGLLYCNDGVWNGDRVLPGGWVKQTVTPAVANKSKEYGYQFWLNGFEEEEPSKHLYPNVPPDMFYCDGYAAQRIYIIPSKKLVIVRLGLTLDGSFDEQVFLKSILESIKNN